MRKMSPWSSVAGRIPCTGLPRLLLQLWDLPSSRISESNASSVVPDEDWMDVFTASISLFLAGLLPSRMRLVLSSRSR